METQPIRKVQLHFDQENKKSVSMTEQSHKKECDINNILSKYVKTGNITHLNKHEANYADVTSLSFREAQETIASANSMFEELPAKTRSKFDNNPATFLDFVQDPKNHQEMYDMGLSKTAPIIPDPESVQPLAEPVLDPPAGAETPTGETT